MLISTAYAQSIGGAAGAGAGIESFLPLVLIFVVFYFLLIRPQQKRASKHQETLKALRVRDKVIIGGGIYGSISKVVSDTEVDVEIADGVKVKVVRSSILEVLTKPEPVADKKSEAADKKSQISPPPSET